MEISKIEKYENFYFPTIDNFCVSVFLLRIIDHLISMSRLKSSAYFKKKTRTNDLLNAFKFHVKKKINP